MKSGTTKKFRASFARLPKQVQQRDCTWRMRFAVPRVQNQARVAYRLFKQNPNHPSLRFKKVHSKLPIDSDRSILVELKEH